MGSVSKLPASLRFNYRDYLLLPEDRRYEIIDGDLYMVPAPVPYHQRIVQRISMLLYQHVVERDLGEVLFAPCDLVLTQEDVVQPDIFFISKDRLAIVGEKYITAAPDLVVEVLSPSTQERDRTIKAKLYFREGVKEMWIADPTAKTVEVLIRGSDGFQRSGFYAGDAIVSSPLLPGLVIPLERVF
jgi:Uma2 family endonuclease